MTTPASNVHVVEGTSVHVDARDAATFSTQALFHVFGSPFQRSLTEHDCVTNTRLTQAQIISAAEGGIGSGDEAPLGGSLTERAAWYYMNYEKWAKTMPLSLEFGVKTSFASVCPQMIDGWLRFAAILMLDKPTVLARWGGAHRHATPCFKDASPFDDVYE